MVKEWPAELTRIVYELLVEMWTDRYIPSWWRWRWLVPLPKKPTAPTIDGLRPIMLIEILRKLWAGLIMNKVHSTVLRHGALHPSQHGFQPGHGTDTANIQLVNVMEEAKLKRLNLFGSSWDMKRAFDSVPKSIIRLAWKRLGVPDDIVNWLVRLDEDSKTVVKSSWAVEQWAAKGYEGLEAAGAFHPETGVGQGDVFSPHTWVAVFDIVLCALDRVDQSDGFMLTSKEGERYRAPAVCYADDVISVASTLEGLQAQGNVMSLCTIVLGLTLAVDKLRAFKCCWATPGRQQSEETLTVFQSRLWEASTVPLLTKGHIKCLGVLYDIDYSGVAQYAASKKLMKTITKVLSKRRASPEVVEAVITTSMLNKAAYQGVLSNWSLKQTLELDGIYAKELKKKSKHMASHPGDNLFRPADQLGMGFTRLTYLIQERKKGSIDRALRSDRYTRRAMEMMLARGAGQTTGAMVDALDGTTKGLWITSVQEYGALADRILRQAQLSVGGPKTTVELMRPLTSWVDVTHTTRKLCQAEGVFQIADLTEMSAVGVRVWRHWAQATAMLRDKIAVTECPGGSIVLQVGQVWQKASKSWLPSLQQGVIEIVGLAEDGQVAYTSWWTAEGDSRVLAAGQTVVRRSTLVRSIAYETFFQDDVNYRRIALASPHKFTKGKAQCIGRKVLWSSPELRPLCGQDKIGHERVERRDTEHWSQVYVCTGQYRKHTCVFSTLLHEDSKETVIGAIVYVKVAADGRYELEADRYQHTEASGSVQPDTYMVDTMLMLQGLIRGRQLAGVGKVCSTNTSLVKKLMDGRFKRKWVKTQQGALAECIWEQLQEMQWETSAVQVLGGSYDKLTDIESKGVYIADEIATRGEEGIPGGEAMLVREQTFVDLQVQVEGQLGWTWVEHATNRLALTETLPMVQKADRRRALATRDAERVQRGEREIWGSNTLKYAAARLQLKESGIARRGHWCRMEHKRH